MSKKKRTLDPKAHPEIPLWGDVVMDRYWMASMYTENMIPSWQEDISDTLKKPFSYCIHNKDTSETGELRKEHVHIILAFSNTTTFVHAFKILNLLSLPDKNSIHRLEACIDIRRCDDYLIHDTEDCRKKGKFQYSKEERIRGNSYDIGAYEQVSVHETNQIILELSNIICAEEIVNYADLFEYLLANYDDWKYFDILKSYSSHFDRLCNGVYRRRGRKDYQKRLADFKNKEENNSTNSTDNSTNSTENSTENSTNSTENSTNFTEICCPKCGSIHFIKRGKTLANTQRFKCNDCGRSFVF